MEVLHDFTGGKVVSGLFEVNILDADPQKFVCSFLLEQAMFLSISHDKKLNFVANLEIFVLFMVKFIFTPWNKVITMLFNQPFRFFLNISWFPGLPYRMTQ